MSSTSFASPASNNGKLRRPPSACIVSEPATVYHSRAGEYLSSHLLADFRKCPQLYYRKRAGLIEDRDRPAYLLGRAVHTFALEGKQQFEREYAVGGPINPKTGSPFGVNTKAFAEWAASHGKAVLTDAQFELVRAMADSVRSHDVVRNLLAAGIAEGVVRTEYCGMPCQIRMDWFEERVGIVDLKTCDDLTWFEADARRYGYAHQMAFYREVYAAASGRRVPVTFVAVEKKEPYRTGVWVVSNETLDIARRENEAAIERLKQCVRTDTWPTGYEECRVFDAV